MMRRVMMTSEGEDKLSNVCYILVFIVHIGAVLHDTIAFSRLGFGYWRLEGTGSRKRTTAK
jgi:hypothetical protein